MTSKPAIGKLRSFVQNHRVGSSVGITAVATITLSIAISFSVVGSIKVEYEEKTRKAVEQTLTYVKNVTDQERNEIVRRIGITNDQNVINNIVNSSENRRLDVTKISYNFDDTDKKNVIGYLQRQLDYYQKLLEQNDVLLNKVYENKRSEFLYKGLDAENQKLVDYFENRRDSILVEQDRVQKAFYRFYNIVEIFEEKKQ